VSQKKYFPSDPDPIVVPVTCVVYKDGSRELFVKSLQMRVKGDQLEFADRRGRIFGRHMKQVDHIEDMDVCYGGADAPPDSPGGGETAG